jgi:hypothetical protein
MRHNDVLVRVSPEVAEQLIDEDSAPVIVVRLVPIRGSAAECDMVVKTPTREQLQEALDAR